MTEREMKEVGHLLVSGWDEDGIRIRKISGCDDYAADYRNEEEIRKDEPVWEKYIRFPVVDCGGMNHERTGCGASGYKSCYSYGEE